MKTELKVGLALVVSLVAIVLGVRFFEGLPVFSRTNTYTTTFPRADGLVAGSQVRINGVAVGTVEGVSLDPETQRVRVRLRIDDLALPTGTTATLGGISALGGVRLDLVPGPPGSAALPDGAEIPSTSAPDLVAQLQDQGPLLAARIDTLLLGAGLTVGEAYRLLGDEDSDLRLALLGLRQSTNTLNRVVQDQSPALAAAIGRAEGTLTSADVAAQEFRLLATDLRGVTATNRDSVALAINRLNTALVRANALFARLDTTGGRVDTLLAKVERGEGNLGMLLNDSTLYVRLDTTLRRTNGLVDDFRRNPGRYLKHIKLVDIF